MIHYGQTAQSQYPDTSAALCELTSDKYFTSSPNEICSLIPCSMCPKRLFFTCDFLINQCPLLVMFLVWELGRCFAFWSWLLLSPCLKADGRKKDGRKKALKEGFGKSAATQEGLESCWTEDKDEGKGLAWEGNAGKGKICSVSVLNHPSKLRGCSVLLCFQKFPCASLILNEN